MASALLASSNEPCWGEPNVYMRKNPLSNPNPRSHANLYPGERTAARFRAAAETEEVPPATAAAVSDDSSSFNRRPVELDRRRDLDRGGGSGYVRFNISTYSKREMRELKRRLVSELDEVQSFISRIQSRDLQSSARSGGFSASGIYGGGREVTSSAAARQSLDPVPSRPSDPSFPKSNKMVSGGKPSLPAASPREPKRMALAPESEKLHAIMMKKCSQILSKMMKHKKSVWFNSPVDVVGMGLHDYFQIIKTPMDLGTVKRKLNKSLYLSPMEFAADVRLTFNNALVYNPSGHEVHKLAEQFLRHFEGLFVPAYQKYEKQLIATEQEEPRFSAVSRLPVPPEVPLLMARIPSPLPASPPAAPSPPPPPLPVNENKHPQPQQQTQMQQQRLPNASRPAASVRLPKPKAKDPNKRPMNFDEKQKLSEGLQSLPPEKMPQVLSIVKKRNANALENGDEIELDIDIMDTETLWELDRFLSNCKKMMSKMRRQEAMASGMLPTAAHSHSHTAPAPSSLPPAEGAGDLSPMSVDAKRCKKGDTAAAPAEEDVDIGDELPGTNYPSVEIQKDAGCASSSSASSSDSDSSSSSDSDSGSSSDSDSDNEEDGGRRRSP